MLKAYKYRIYPNSIQKELLAQHFGCARWVYNWALDKKKKHYEKTEKFLSKRSLQNDLVALKKTEEHGWLKQVNSQSLLATLWQLNTAFKNFFDKRAKHPKFKKKHNKQTYQCPQHVQIDKHLNLIHLPKIKSIKIKQHRSFSGNIKTVTLTKTPSNKYYASILIENTNDYPALFPIQSEKTIGIDLGLSHFAITSQEEKVENPKPLKASLKELGIAQKINSRKDYKKRSSNYRKQCIKIAKIHEKIANKRYDFIQQYTAKLMYENQVTSFAVENLHVKGMIRNKCLARSISDSAWGMFFRVLTYKSKLYGKNVLTIDRFVASSKTCHLCGNQKEKLPLSIRKWECSCGAQHDRDINAAKVIKKQALADTLGLSDCIKSSSVTIPVSAGVTARG